MATPLRVLGVSGSLRNLSYNRGLLEAARELVPEGMEIVTFDGLGAIPPYDQDVEDAGDPAPVAAWKDAIRTADALLIATPEYNYGVPGVLKNAIDWASRPPASSVLKGKPAAIMGASPGQSGTVRSQLQLRQAFLFTETYAMLKPEVAIAKCRERFDPESRLTDESTRAFLAKFLAALAAWIVKIR